MKAGRELDALVAEKVMGWHPDLCGGKYEAVKIPAYSSSISAAWEVVEKLQERALCVALEWTITDGWAFGITPHDFPYEFCIKENASSIPLAICLAALKTVE